MSGYRTHLLFYSTVAFITQWILATLHMQKGTLTDLTAIAIGAAYTLLPDIDAPHSKAKSAAWKTLSATAVLTFIGYAMTKDGTMKTICAASAITLCIMMLLRHRGALHSSLFAVILAAPIAIISPYHALWALLGYETHLLLDGTLSN